MVSNQKKLAKDAETEEANAKDLLLLLEMLSRLRDIKNNAHLSSDQILELADIASQITYMEKNENCVRNKYGTVNRAKQCIELVGGIAFMQMAWMRHVAPPLLGDLSAEEKTSMYADFAIIKQKIDDVRLHLTKNISTEIDMTAWQRENTFLNWIELRYLDRLIIKLKEVLLDPKLSHYPEQSNLNFGCRENRYYFGTVLTRVGELCNDLLFLSCCCKDVDFYFFKRLRNNMMHEHKAMHTASIGMQEYLYVIQALLCRGLLPKVTIIGDELSKAKLIAFGIVGYHAHMTDHIKITHNSLNKWIESENLTPLYIQKTYGFKKN